ncbi:MAG: DNA polymerase IV [Planctomycetes bacterium]|nr:DNA polymerase IV [Planctomycetota bacterium]
MDAFYAAIEQRDHPELRGKPVIVGGDQPRTVVSTASYEARRFGVHSAMPGVQARRLCPHGIFLPPRMDAYVAVSQQIRQVFELFTDQIEPLSLDEAFLDVTGSQALFGDGEAIAQRLKAEVLAATRLTVSVGVASSKYVAKVASDLRKPDGLVVVPPGQEREFLAPLPVARLWGAGPKTQQVLQRARLAKIGDIQQQPLAELTRVLGEHMAVHFHTLARGEDPRAVEPERQAKSIGHELTFAQDLQTRDEVEAILLQLAEAVGRRLRQAGVSATTVRLKLRLPDFTTTLRQQKVAPTQDDLELHRTAVRLCRQAWSGRPGVRLLGVTAAELVPAATGRQGELFGEPPDKHTRVLAAMDAIRDRFGEKAIRHGGQRRTSTPFGPIEGA